MSPCFIWDELGHFCNNAIWIIPTEDKALLAILNSPVGWYLISSYCTQIQNGYQLIYKYLEKIPIPRIDPSDRITLSKRNEIIKLTDNVLKLNTEIDGEKIIRKLEQLKSKIQHQEAKLNSLIYELYELTPDEIKIVEGTNS